MSEVYFPQCRVTLSAVFEGFGGGDSDPTIIPVIPREAQVNLTGYKECDTWSLTFDAKALPISPDLIRSLAVEIRVFDAKSNDPSDLVELSTAARTLLVTGLADNIAMSWSSQGRELTCDGRDYTALLIDKHWNPEQRVPGGRPLTEVVQELVDIATQKNTHGGRTLTVVYKSDRPVPICGQYKTKTNKKGKPIKSGENVWDVIYKLCIDEGLIVFVRGWDVIVTDPQTLTIASARMAKKVVYGRNLSSLKMERKLGKEKVPQIEVRAYSSKARGDIVAKYPEKADDRVTGVGTKTEEVLKFTHRGVDDVSVLKEFAKAKYNDLARGEQKIHFITKSLRDLSTSSSQFNLLLSSAKVDDAQQKEIIGGGQDMLQLRAGDPIVIGFGMERVSDTLMEQADYDRRYQLLREQGYSPAVAKLIAREWERIDQFKRPFYTRDVQVSWSYQEGVTLDVEAVNFSVPKRNDATAQESPTKGAKKVR